MARKRGGGRRKTSYSYRPPPRTTRKYRYRFSYGSPNPMRKYRKPPSLGNILGGRRRRRRA